MHNVFYVDVMTWCLIHHGTVNIVLWTPDWHRGAHGNGQPIALVTSVVDVNGFDDPVLYGDTWLWTRCPWQCSLHYLVLIQWMTLLLVLVATEMIDLYRCMLSYPASSMGAEPWHGIAIGTFGFHRTMCWDVIDMREASSYPSVYSTLWWFCTTWRSVISSTLLRTDFTGCCGV